VFTGAVSNLDQTVSAVIKNGGNDMAGTVPYEVWWAEKGNPKEGIKVGDGMVPALKSGETFNLKFSTEKPGNYMFKAYQRPNHGDPNNKKESKGNGNAEGALWSEQITVTGSIPDMQPKPEKGNEQQGQQAEIATPVDEQSKESDTQTPDSEVNQPTEPDQQPKSDETTQTTQSEETMA
jgi:hypothetical protein